MSPMTRDRVVDLTEDEAKEYLVELISQLDEYYPHWRGELMGEIDGNETWY